MILMAGRRTRVSVTLNPDHEKLLTEVQSEKRYPSVSDALRDILDDYLKRKSSSDDNQKTIDVLRNNMSLINTLFEQNPSLKKIVEEIKVD